MKQWICRVFFALVWLVNGLFCKVLDGVPPHRWIVARILGEDHSMFLTRLIGIAEIAMAIWILTGFRPKWSAIAQISAVGMMNVIEFFLAPDLLLYGKANSLVAMAYMALVAWAEFWWRSRKSSLKACDSPS
jgi:uncharacterized membrane protein YphA (DoxX/SURF4 family)